MRKRFKTKEYNSSYITFILLCVISPIVLILAVLYDNVMYKFCTSIFIPIMLVIIACVINKCNVLHHSFVDIQLYDNVRTIKEDAMVWINEGGNKIQSVLAINNIGDSLISTVEIIINPQNIKTDIMYRIPYPLAKGEIIFVGLPINSNQVKKVNVQYFSDSVDNSRSFGGKQIQVDYAKMFSDISPVTDYRMTKIKNNVSLKRNIMRNINLEKKSLK